MIPLAPSHGLRHDGVVLIPGPLYHNAPFTFACLGLFYGNHVVVMPRFDAEATLAAIDRHRPDLVLLVPTMMSRVLRLDDSARERYDISSLQTVWHMGAPCAPWVKERWLHWVGPEKVWELYTGTESQAVTTVRGDEWLAKPGTVGRVTSGEMQIVDTHTLQKLPAGKLGEIFLRRSAGTPETYRYVGAEPYAIDDGWESLGDMGWFDDDGYLFLADRRADMILSGGANIYPAEIEAALIEHSAVQSCAVVGLPDDDLGQVVHAILQPIDAAAVPSDDDLRAFLAQRVIRYKVPRDIRMGERAGARRRRKGTPRHAPRRKDRSMTVQFGVHIGPQKSTLADLRQLWRWLDEAGADWISVWDHLYEAPAEGGTQPHFEAIALLGAIAADTSRARLGCLVFCAPYRNIGLFAKSITTIDHISGGRFEVGMGSGWYEAEAKAYGLRFPGQRERFDILEEQLEVLLAWRGGERVTKQTAHHALSDASLIPTPIGRLPIWVGGIGRQRTLRMTGALADGWNATYIGADEFRELSGVLDDWCVTAGREPAAVERSINLMFNLSNADPAAA